MADDSEVIAATGHATLTFSGVATPQMSMPLWFHWAQIAKQQAALSRAAATAYPAGNMLDEMHPAMIAITATAIALDGLYDQVAFVDAALPQGSSPSDSRPPRQRVILERLKRAFALGKKGHDWLIEFDRLDALRDPAVHPEETLAPPTPHPRWGNTALEVSLYSAEAAEWAFALLLDVLTTCVANPKPMTKDWAATQLNSSVPELSS